MNSTSARPRCSGAWHPVVRFCQQFSKPLQKISHTFSSSERLYRDMSLKSRCIMPVFLAFPSILRTTTRPLRFCSSLVVCLCDSRRFMWERQARKPSPPSFSFPHGDVLSGKHANAAPAPSPGDSPARTSIAIKILSYPRNCCKKSFICNVKEKCLNLTSEHKKEEPMISGFL